MPSYPDWNDADLQAAAPTLDEWIGVYNLPRAVVYGLVSQESRFKPTAYRAEPAIGDASYGLTQILYGTAKGLGYGGSPEGLFAPEANVQFGLLYLRNALDRFGDVGQALSAYNSGHATGSSAGDAYAAAVLDRASYFDQVFGTTDAAPVDSTSNDVVVNDPGTGGAVPVNVLLALAGIALAWILSQRGK